MNIFLKTITASVFVIFSINASYAAKLPDSECGTCIRRGLNDLDACIESGYSDKERCLGQFRNAAAKCLDYKKK